VNVVIERWSHRHVSGSGAFSQADYTTVLGSWPNAFDPADQVGPRRLPALQGKLVTSLAYFETELPGPQQFRAGCPAAFGRCSRASAPGFQFPSPKGESLLDTAPHLRGDGKLMWLVCATRWPGSEKPGAPTLIAA